ncbi:helix-turn-helix domain-containing protein [Pseudalkalibacillus decolorationis]|uniref:helix-turn-helix domain-containing protein n=1 Tax=Pseudalkalibacillus decolorationis TaxID=163879 RepID=UPI0021477E7F|nr:helix-turn-helix domain-containing protein [Pseudalkalibacillus decolorationis]
MTHILDQEQDKMWESVQTLAEIDVDQAKAVFKAVIERSLQQLDLLTPMVSSMRLSLPSADDLLQLQSIEKSMRDALAHQDEEKTYEILVDYIEYVSKMVEDDPHKIQKKLLASFLSEGHKRKMKLKQVDGIYAITTPVAPLSKEIDVAYYTPKEVAKKLGLSDQTIRRMCEKGKFEGAYKTDGGHWKIPQGAFITTTKQDKRAEDVLRRIDANNKEAGDVDEFDL